MEGIRKFRALPLDHCIERIAHDEGSPTFGTADLAHPSASLNEDATSRLST